VSLTGIVFLGITTLKRINQTERDNRELKLNFEICKAENSLMQANMSSVFTLESSTIDLAIKCIKNESIHFEMRDLIKSKTLVYKFSTYDCMTCVSQQFNLLNELREKSPVDLLCLINYSNLREFKSLLLTVPEDIAIYGVKDFPFYEQAYFVLDVNGAATNFFIPDKNNISLTRQYLSIIDEKLGLY